MLNSSASFFAFIRAVSACISPSEAATLILALSSSILSATPAWRSASAFLVGAIPTVVLPKADPRFESGSKIFWEKRPNVWTRSLIRACSVLAALLSVLLSLAFVKAAFFSFAPLIIRSYSFWESDIVGFWGITFEPLGKAPYISSAPIPLEPASISLVPKSPGRSSL